ncbi:MAG: outer membrane protein assembly factor BamC [Pseudomonadota bacterium]
MQMRNLFLASLIFSLLAGCSLLPGKEPVDYKNGSASAPALEVPPDLTMPANGQRYAIPEQEGTQVASYSAYTRAVAAEPAAPCAAAETAATATTATSQGVRMMSVEGRDFLLLDDPFDRAWRKVKLALERAKLATSDVDRSKGLFFLKPNGEPPREMRVQVRESGGASVVTVQTAEAADSARVLETLYRQMGN